MGFSIVNFLHQKVLVVSVAVFQDSGAWRRLLGLHYCIDNQSELRDYLVGAKQKDSRPNQYKASKQPLFR